MEKLHFFQKVNIFSPITVSAPLNCDSSIGQLSQGGSPWWEFTCCSVTPGLTCQLVIYFPWVVLLRLGLLMNVFAWMEQLALSSWHHIGVEHHATPYMIVMWWQKHNHRNIEGALCLCVCTWKICQFCFRGKHSSPSRIEPSWKIALGFSPARIII